MILLTEYFREISSDTLRRTILIIQPYTEIICEISFDICFRSHIYTDGDEHETDDEEDTCH
jgi:hypothetical protein